MNWIKTITKLFSNKSKEQSLDEKLALQVLANMDIDDIDTWCSSDVLNVGSFKYMVLPCWDSSRTQVFFYHDLDTIATFNKSSEVYRVVKETCKEVQRHKHEKLVKGLLEKVGSYDN